MQMSYKQLRVFLTLQAWIFPLILSVITHVGEIKHTGIHWDGAYSIYVPEWAW